MVCFAEVQIGSKVGEHRRLFGFVSQMAGGVNFGTDCATKSRHA
jgi:hypothetical protein